MKTPQELERYAYITNAADHALHVQIDVLGQVDVQGALIHIREGHTTSCSLDELRRAVSGKDWTAVGDAVYELTHAIEYQGEQIMQASACLKGKS